MKKNENTKPHPIVHHHYHHLSTSGFGSNHPQTGQNPRPTQAQKKPANQSNHQPNQHQQNHQQKPSFAKNNTTVTVNQPHITVIHHHHHGPQKKPAPKQTGTANVPKSATNAPAQHKPTKANTQNQNFQKKPDKGPFDAQKVVHHRHYHEHQHNHQHHNHGSQTKPSSSNNGSQHMNVQKTSKPFAMDAAITEILGKNLSAKVLSNRFNDSMKF